MAVGILAGVLISLGSAGIQYAIASRRKLPPTERGRNSDLRITGSGYGEIIPRIWGRVRLAPQIIYASGIREIARQTQERVQGGKGGGRTQTVIDYSYYTTLLLAGCANQVNSIDRIWANSDTIFNLQPDPNLFYYEAEEGTRSGGASITSDAGCSSGYKVTGLGSGGKLTFNDLPSAIAPTDTTTNIFTTLTVYYKSASEKTLYVAVDGGTPVAYTMPATGSDVNTKTIQLDGVHPESIEFSNSGASTVDIDRISVWFSYLNTMPLDVPVTGIYDDFMSYPDDEFNSYSKYNYRPTANESTGISSFQTINTTGVRTYLGTETQTADAAIIADLDLRYGSGNGVNYASAYRGIAGAVLHEYQLPGAQLPNFTMEMNQGTTTLSGILTQLFAEKDIDSSYLDLSALSGKTLSGLVVYQLQTPQSVVELLEQWFNFKMVGMDGKLKAVLRNQSPIAVISNDDLRAHEGDEIPDFDAIIEPVPEHLLPKEINVSYLDKSAGIDYKNNAETSRLFGTTLAQDIQNPSFPFVSVPVEAKAVAENLLSQAHVRDNIINELSLMPKYARYTPCDVLTLELENASIDFEITKKTFVAGGKCLIEGLSSDEITVSANVGNFSNNPDVLFDNAKFPANTELVVFESVPVQLTDEGLGVYAAVCQKGTGKWRGCALYNRINTDDDWIFTRKIETSSPIGIAQNTLADHTSDTEDTTNELTIFFYEDVTLETVTSDDLAANPQRNLIRVGDEWLQFRTATAETLTDSRFRSAWTLSNLTRGLFATSAAKATHSADESCVVYSSALQFVALDSTYADQTVNFLAATYGQSQDFGKQVSLTLDNLSTGGQAPTDLIERITTTNLVLTQGSAATNTAVTLNIAGYSESSRFRKIYVAESSDMSDAVLLPLQDANLLGGTLPLTYDYTKSSETSAVHRYFRIEQSVNGIDYKQSNILDVTFASSGGSGGSGTLTQPVISLAIDGEDAVSAEIEITLDVAGSGTGNYFLERSTNSGSTWSVNESNVTFPFTDTVTKTRFSKLYSYRTKRQNDSSPSSEIVAILVEGAESELP